MTETAKSIVLTNTYSLLPKSLSMEYGSTPYVGMVPPEDKETVPRRTVPMSREANSKFHVSLPSNSLSSTSQQKPWNDPSLSSGLAEPDADIEQEGTLKSQGARDGCEELEIIEIVCQDISNNDAGSDADSDISAVAEDIVGQVLSENFLPQSNASGLTELRNRTSK